MPVQASPPDCLDISLPSERKLGPRFGYSLEINQSIGPSCHDPDVRLHKADMLGDGHASVERATATGTGDGRHRQASASRPLGAVQRARNAGLQPFCPLLMSRRPLRSQRTQGLFLAVGACLKTLPRHAVLKGRRDPERSRRASGHQLGHKRRSSLISLIFSHSRHPAVGVSPPHDGVR